MAGYRHRVVRKNSSTDSRQRAASRHTVDFRPLVDAQIEQALGLSYLVVRDKTTGKFLRVSASQARHKVKLAANEELLEVWEKDPSTAAFKDLMDRELDKPKEQPQEVALSVTGELALGRPQRRTPAPPSGTPLVSTSLV